MTKEEFLRLFSQLSPEQQKILYIEWKNLLNAHNSAKKLGEPNS